MIRRLERFSIPSLMAAGVIFVYAAFLPPANFCDDGNSMLAVSESLLLKGSFEVPPKFGLAAADGKYYSIWYPLFPVLGLPFTAAGLAAGRIAGVPPHYSAVVAMILFSVLLTGLCAALLVLCVRRLGGNAWAGCLAALAFAFGTPALVYGRTLYTEALFTCLVLASFYEAVTKRRPVLLFLYAAGVVLAKPAGIGVGGCIVLYFLVKKEKRPLAASAAGVTAGAILFAAYNWARFGSCLALGYDLVFSLSRVPAGITGLLASPGRGLFFYAPACVAALFALRACYRKNPPETLLMAALMLYLLFLHAAWGQWHGGWSWGSRLLMPAASLLLAAAGLLTGRRQRIFIGLILLGFLVNSPSLVSFYQRYYVEEHDKGVSEKALLWSFGKAPFLHAWPSAARQIGEARVTDVRSLTAGLGAYETHGEIFKVVAVWWWMLPLVHVPRAAGAGMALLTAGAGVLMILSAFGRGKREAISVPLPRR